MKTRLDERFDPDPQNPWEEERLRQADRPVASRSTPGPADDPIPPQEYRPEPPVPVTSEETPTLQIGVFFDGTGNNMHNDRHLPDRDITNVAKLYDLYSNDPDKGNYRIYIQGVGTITGRESEDGFTVSDNLIGLGTGVGPEGGHARIAEALSQVREILEANPLNALVTFDVFGFSRGAALARHFVNLIHRWPEHLLVPDFRPGIPMFRPPLRRITAFPPSSIPFPQVRFVGLFDTVGSFYLPGTTRNLDFDLYITSGSATRVVQLTAHHEIRRNFPLSSIADTQGNHPGNFAEIALPGAHSDVGGGYENPNLEVGFSNHEELIVRRRAGLGANGETIRRAQAEAKARGLNIRVDGMDVLEIERRATRKELAIYPLHQMHDEARRAWVPLRNLDDADPDHVIPAGLQDIIDNWWEEGSRHGLQWMLDVSRDRFADYIHTSHRQESLAHAPEPTGVRRVFSNRPVALATVPQEPQDA